MPAANLWMTMDFDAISAAAGVLALLIAVPGAYYAWKAHQRGKFIPRVKARIDTGKRIHLHVRNVGGRAGEVYFVRLFGPEHSLGDAEVLMYQYEHDGVLSADLLTPFPLPGNASADLIIVPDEEVEMDGVKVDIDYGGGHTSGCVAIKPIVGHIPGSSRLPTP